MLKFFGFAVIIVSTTLTGNYFSLMLKCRLNTLKKMNYMLDEIIMLLRFRSSTVYEIARELRESGRFGEFGFLNGISEESGIPFQRNWREAVMKDTPQGLDRNGAELLADVGAKLGTSDTESQINTLYVQQAELASFIAAAEADYEKKAKLYRSMGVLAGAFISIMLV